MVVIFKSPSILGSMFKNSTGSVSIYLVISAEILTLYGMSNNIPNKKPVTNKARYEYWKFIILLL